MKKSLFDQQIQTVFHRALKLAWRRPGCLPVLGRLALSQQAAWSRRRRWDQKGLQVPPVLIASLLKECNLACAGCYQRGHGKKTGPSLQASQYLEIFRQARELGVGIILLAGGEPLLFPGLFSMTRELSQTAFLLFTNGMLLDREKALELRRQKHVFPVLSLEGDAKITDQRRGAGVFAQVREAMRRLEKNRIFWGVSVTVTRENFNAVVRREYIRELAGQGCRLVFFIEYVPIEPGTEDWVPTPEQRRQLYNQVDEANAGLGVIAVALPGNETEFGGCLAAGRGFLHLASDGSLEPCPFAPFADINLTRVSFQEGLKSVLLRKLRENHSQLSETEGGCALWANRNWVGTLLGKNPDANPPA